MLDFEQQLVQWYNKIVKTRPTECTQETFYYVNNTPDIDAKTDHMSNILDAKYQPENLDKVAAKNKNVMAEQRRVLHELLKT